MLLIPYTGGKIAVSASRLVKSPDSHASDPCSRLGGSSWLCYEIFISEFNEMREEKISSRATLREKRKARCPRMNSLAKYLALQYIRRYIAEFNEIECCSSQYSGKNRVTLTMKRIEAGRQFPMIKQLPWQLAVNRGAVGESRTSGRRGKTPWGKPVSAINTVRKSQAASRWGPWKFRPSTAYGAFQPHTRAQTRVPGQWVGYSSAVPGCHNSVGQMSPGRTQLLLLLLGVKLPKRGFLLNVSK